MADYVREIMRHDVITCRADMSIREIYRLMVENETKVIIVLDEGDEACGVITPKEILRHTMEDLSKLVAEEVMSFPIEVVGPEVWITEVGAIMAEKGVDYLIIMHGVGLQPLRPVGFITAEDVIKAVISKIEQ